MIQNRRQQVANRRAKKKIGKLWPIYSQLAQELEVKLPATPSRPRTIGCSAMSRGDGASTVASNLAASIAMISREPVLFINATESRPKNGLFGVTANEGLEQLLDFSTEFADVIVPTRIENVDYLGNGLRSREQFSPHIISKFPEIIEQFRQKYSTVIVDLPSQDRPTSSSPLVSKVDGLVLVIQPKKVKPTDARRVRDALERSGVNVLGAVMNRHKN